MNGRIFSHAKLLFTALLLLFTFFTFFAFSTATSADNAYTTDGDDATQVDWLLMEADDIKLATGSKGQVIYNEDGHKVVRYTPEETYISPEGGMLHITPSNSNAGYASTGENSFFDFPYSVVYYKTSSTAQATGNLMLNNGSSYKWNGGEHIKRSTTYTGIIIDRDSYTSGNPTATTPYTNAEKTQRFTLKTFPTANVDGYLDIVAIASFRTKDQASSFISEYSPKFYTYTSDGDDSTEVDCIIMNADDIKLATGEKGTVALDENKYKVVSYTPSESNSADESHRLFFKPENSNAGFAASGENSLFDFSYYVVYYRVSSTANSIIDVNFYNGSIYKWSGKHTIKQSSDYTAGIIYKETFTSGNTTSHTTYPESTWTNQQMSFKAFPSADVEGSLDIEAIAAFRTKDQAEYFIATYTPETHKVLPPYATDNDDSTEVDCIFMNAAQLKLATGDDGTLTTDIDGNSVLLVRPEESYESPESGQICITPAKSNAGFAESGENSLFDFPYYVIRYKSTNNALNTYTTMISGIPDGETSNSFMLNGTQLPQLTDYGFTTIERDTFTSDSSTTQNETPDSAWTNQAINLKIFATADVDGYAYIQEFAAFRTSEQAEDYITNYDTYKLESNDEIPYLILDSSDLSDVSSSSFFTKSDVYDDETGKAFVKFTANSNGTHSDGTSFNLNTSSLAADITLKEYPIIKIAYKAKITDTNTSIDFNLGLDYLGVSTRIWAIIPATVKDETLSYITINVPEAGFYGGENLSGTKYSYNNIDDDSTYNFLRLKPFMGGNYYEGDYFAIEYIGFFKTEKDAAAYSHNIDRTLKSISLKYNTFKLLPGKTLLNPFSFHPTYADVSTLSFTSSDDNIAVFDESCLISAVNQGTAMVSVTDEATGLSASTKVIVENPSPIDWYALDSEEGDTIVVNLIGDSISYGAGTADKNNTFHGRWTKAFKMSVNSWSRPGSAVTGNLLYSGTMIETFVPRMERMIQNDVQAYDKITTNDAPDMIIIYGGTNDYNGNWGIGKVSDSTRDTFCGAISELIQLSWVNYPDAKLVFFTPIKRTDYSPTNGQDNTGTRRYELDAYVDAMIETCAYYGVDCIDLYNNEQANLIGLRTTYIKDGVHMTDEGHRIFAKVAIEEMEKAGVIKTHGFTAEPGATYTLDADRDLSAESHIYDAAALDTLATYSAGTLLDRQRMSKHTLTEEGSIRFSAETLTSKLAPAITVDFSQLDFAITDYPYMSVVYKTDSSAKNINAELRGNDNHVSKLDSSVLPSLVSGKTAAFTVNVKDYTCDDIDLTGNTINNDLHMTLGFFNSTKDMTSESYVDIEYIAFFKTAEDAALFNAEKAPEKTIGDVNGDGNVDASDSVVLSRYLAEWSSYSEIIVDYNCNIDGNEAIEAADSVILSRYLAKWNGYETLPYEN